MLKIFCDDEKASGLELISRVLGECCKLEAQSESLQIELEFVSKEDIREINNDNRGVDKATDVLSFPTLEISAGQKISRGDFPFDIDPETANVDLGSIVICEEIAREQSVEYGHSYERELAYLALHGFLHLLGYDHMREDEKDVMRASEEKVLDALGIRRD